jgi:predicted lipid-binding transport protein (Tim44 family)
MRNPFVQGLAGGLLGGFVGNLLFGGRGYASPPGGMGGGGIGLLDIILIGLLLYFVMKYFRRRRMQSAGAEGYSGQSYTQPQYDSERYLDTSQDTMLPPVLDVDRNLEQGLAQIKRRDPRFNENEFKEIVQDLFFRIQAAWMNRSLEGAGDILADEMANIMASEFAAMNQKGQINRLENIAVRKVEIAEAWQESGKDYMTVLFTANLLDYTVDDKSGEVVAGDRRNPVKFEEFWTFCRAVGESQWRLTAINQVK